MFTSGQMRTHVTRTIFLTYSRHTVQETGFSDCNHESSHHIKCGCWSVQEFPTDNIDRENAI
jgi:hypothetical protein